MVESKKAKKENLWGIIQDQLEQHGVDLKAIFEEGTDWSDFNMVCVSPDLTESVEALGKTTRDQVVMVRLDKESTKSLDAWVEAGAVKNRSQAAALFIREGLKVREAELDQLKEALNKVEKAKEKLKKKAAEIFKGQES